MGFQDHACLFNLRHLELTKCQWKCKEVHSEEDFLFSKGKTIIGLATNYFKKLTKY